MPPALVTIDRRRVWRAQLALITLLGIASLLVQVGVYKFDHESLGGLAQLFNANGEGNLPTYYSALSLLACALLFAVLGAAEREASPSAAGGWLGLAAVAGLASLDEAAVLHETMGSLIDRGFTPGGFLYYVWVVPGAIVLIVLATAWRSFIARLESSLRRTLMLGVGLWAGSALLLELVESRIISSNYGFPTFEQALVGTLQETGEMLGVAVILDGLLRYLAVREVVAVGSVSHS